jgi:hypothetical protein
VLKQHAFSLCASRIAVRDAQYWKWLEIAFLIGIKPTEAD